MNKDLRCSSCGRTIHKYDALYIGGTPVCPYCEGNCVDVNYR